MTRIPDAVPDPTAALADGESVLDRLGRAEQRLADLTRATAFWTAVALPALHGVILLDGVGNRGRATLLVGLLVANVLALRVGHGHRRDRAV